MSVEMDRGEQIRRLSRLEREKTDLSNRMNVAFISMVTAIYSLKSLFSKWQEAQVEQDGLIETLKGGLSVPAPVVPPTVAKVVAELLDIPSPVVQAAPPIPVEPPVPAEPVPSPVKIDVPAELNAKNQMVYALAKLADLNPTFLQRMSDHPKCHGTTRHYVAKSPSEIYTVPELYKYCAELPGGWWVATNLSNRDKMKLLFLAEEIANATITVHFDNL